MSTTYFSLPYSTIQRKSPKQTIRLTMITTYGVATGKYNGIVQKEVCMEDLFR